MNREHVGEQVRDRPRVKAQRAVLGPIYEERDRVFARDALELDWHGVRFPIDRQINPVRAAIWAASAEARR
jgi:hypothetical protein